MNRQKNNNRNSLIEEGFLEILDLVEAQYKLAKKHRDIWKKKLLKRTTKPKEEIKHGLDRKR
jgi:hypothetical protein